MRTAVLGGSAAKGRFVSLPMYDWPEEREVVDRQWSEISSYLRKRGVAAPEALARRNADLPPVEGGIRDAGGKLVAPDPALLPPNTLDLFTLWRHPRLLLGQTCWGPMEFGLSAYVKVVAQPSYDGLEGGSGEDYSSAIVMRRGEAAGPVAAPEDGSARIPMNSIEKRRFAFNNPDSMSGLVGISKDLEALGTGLDLFDRWLETGSHRQSIIAVAEGRADVAAIDCRSWALAKTYEPRARMLEVVGWTSRRKGLPFITSLETPDETVALLAEAVMASSAAHPADRSRAAVPLAQ